MEEEGDTLVDHEQLSANVWQPDDDAHQRQVRYDRLCTLVIREGTERLKEYVKNNTDRNMDLTTLLEIDKIHNVFVNLKKKRAITVRQYEILYPNDGGNMQDDKVDINLWVILARNLVEDRELINWDKSPGPDDDLHGHHLLRIRNARNHLYHTSRNEVSYDEYQSMWSSICASLLKLGSTQQRLHDIRTCDLDPEKTRIYGYEIQQQTLEEQNRKLENDAANRRWIFAGFGVIIVLLVAAVIIIVERYSQPQPCSKNLQRLPTNIAQLNYMTRSGWGARDPEQKRLENFEGPVDQVVITFTGINDNCLTHEACCLSARETQNMDMAYPIHFADIVFNYLIGGDGVAYEGRGTYYTPAIVPWANRNLISIAFIGYFTQSIPTPAAMSGVRILIQHLADSGALSHNTTVLGLCQMWGEKYDYVPGPQTMAAMKHWQEKDWRWRPFNVSHCVNDTVQMT